MCNNLTWDYPSDTVGYTTGIAAELNQPRLGFALRVLPDARRDERLYR